MFTFARNHRNLVVVIANPLVDVAFSFVERRAAVEDNFLVCECQEKAILHCPSIKTNSLIK